jgi:uncharacterized protein
VSAIYQRALITGASSGIGEEFARQLHAQGLFVCLVARRAERLEALAATFNSQRPASAEVLVCDLASDDKAHGLPVVLRHMQQKSFDVLINNAGRGSFGFFHDLPVDGELGQVRLNIEASLQISHALVPAMVKARRGAIINVSSVAAFQPLGFMSTYAATKCFNLFHSLGLRQELAEYNIRVIAVCPGPTATEFGGVARVPGTVTSIKRDDVGTVVRNSLRGLETNSAIVFPSKRSLGLALVSRLLPLAFSSFFVARSLKSVLLKSQSDVASK